MASESLNVKISAEVKDFLSGCDQMVSGLDEVGKKFENLNKIGEGFKSVGKQMTAVGVGIIASMGGIVAKGSEWQANAEATEYLYKNLDKSVQKSIATNEKNAKSIGMTTKQYKENATEMANFYKNMQLTTDETSKLTENTMNLASDLAAFSDLPINDVMGDMKSAMLGNFEVMDKYNVSLSVGKINNGEYAKSIGKTWEKMTEAEKVQAVYNETLAQTSGITGLGKQEADGFASQMNILQDNISNLVGEIGASLLPTLQPLVEKFTEVAEKIREWVQANPELTGKILTVVGVIGVLAATLGPLLIFIGTLITSFSAISGAITAVSGAFALLSGPVLIVIGVITALIAIGVALYKNWDTIKAYAGTIWNTIKTTIMNVVNALKSGLTNDFNNMKSTITNAWNAIKSGATNAWNGIKNTVTKSINAAKDSVSNAINKIKSLLTGFKPSWSIPKPKLPKISVSIGYKTVGSLKIPYPDFNVSWNAKGGIFNKPTIFSTPAGFQGVGERGAEAILPLKSFYAHLDEKLDNNIDYDKLAQAMVRANQESGTAIYLDGNTLVGGVIARTEEKMGGRVGLAERGLIL